MNNFCWHFKQQRRGDRDRNPIQNAFFDSEAVGSLVSALVREGLQNSGDARSLEAPDGMPVRVRIFTSGDQHALPANKMSFWANGLWDHVAVGDSGLRRAPTKSDPCKFLVFEDFGTFGLEGPTESDTPSKDPYYCFFRAENATSKSADSGGSWGVGKTAFPRASRANALFALSTRESDERTVLMGSMTLRTHHVKGNKFSPDSWFGVPEDDEDDGGIIQPIEDADTILRFHNEFKLSRPLSGDSAACMGTSIVVPWCDPKLTKESIIHAVIESNFLPIISGDLVVSVGDSTDPDEDLVLAPGSIEDAVADLATPDLLASVHLAKWVRDKGDEGRVSAVHEPGSPSVKWEQYSLPEADRDRLRQQFDAGNPIIIRVPVPMKKKCGGGEHTSHLEVALHRTFEGNTIRPVFVRGSVVVPDQRIKKVQGALAIIRSERDELGNLLRAAEDPGHKEWSSETDNFYPFTEGYFYAKSYLTLARDAAIRVHRLLQDVDTEEDFDLLGDVFSLPKSPDDDGIKPGEKGRTRRRTKKPKIKIKERPPQMVEARQIIGGFKITRASDKSPTPGQITVRAGYDRRKGDPIKKWDKADFEFGTEPIVVDRSQGVEIEEISDNVIRMRITDPDFELAVTGFKPSRGDVVVRVRSEGRFNA